MSVLTIDHNELDAALKRCGSIWNAGQTHGLLCSRLALSGADGAVRWLEQVLADTDPGNALRAECQAMLESLYEITWQQLAERQSEFTLLLPNDDASAAVRAAAMAQWCAGFLHGLVSESHGDALRQRLASEPLSDIIKDLIEISRATAGDDNDEGNERAFTELVEYLRVAAQLAYEELAEFRGTSTRPLQGGSGRLH